MTASKQIKESGLDSLKQVVEITRQSPQTLRNWCIWKPELFEVVIDGCLHQLNRHKPRPRVMSLSEIEDALKELQGGTQGLEYTLVASYKSMVVE